MWSRRPEWKPFLCLIPYFPLGNLNKSHLSKPHFASPYFIMVWINSAYRRREKEEWRRETKKREWSTPANIATCWTSKAPTLRLSGCGVHRMASCSHSATEGERCLQRFIRPVHVICWTMRGRGVRMTAHPCLENHKWKTTDYILSKRNLLAKDSYHCV